MKKIKHIVATIALASLFIAGSVYAERTVVSYFTFISPNIIYPVDSTYVLGNASNQIANGYFTNLTVGTCTGCGGGGGTFPFTQQSYGVSTSTVVNFIAGLMAGTSTFNGALTFNTLNTGSLAVSQSGLVYVAATTTGANPSGTGGLSAVNGSATTYMRSDGAPALSQAIIPTWTGLHTFNTAGLIATASSTIQTLRSTFMSVNGAGLGSAAIEAKSLTTGSIGGLRIEADNVNNTQFSSFVTGDAQIRFSFLADGIMKWSSGAATPDVQLSRSVVGGLSVVPLNAATRALFGVGTSTPWAALSIEGTSTLGNFATAGYFVATSTQPSTFVSAIFSTILRAPYGAAPTVATNGDLGVDSTSNQVKYQSGASTLVLGNGTINSAFVFATSSMGTGTTTLRIAGFQTATTFSALSCTSRGGGTFVAVLGDSVASATPVLSGTSLTRTFTTLSSNNVFTAGEDTWYGIGSVSGAVSDPSCSYTRALTAD